MNNKLVAKKLWQNARKVFWLTVCFLTLSFPLQGINGIDQGFAEAALLTNHHPILANLGNSGFQNQVEGRAQQDIGRTQEALQEAGNQVQKSTKRAADKADAVGKQIQGRAQQDIGRTQDAFQDAGNQVEDATENAIDAVKNFFEQ